jgi:hypothetical protein
MTSRLEKELKEELDLTELGIEIRISMIKELEEQGMGNGDSDLKDREEFRLKLNLVKQLRLSIFGSEYR